ncbi:MAG: hypothetical protein LBS11_04635 [Oscillospiraceae bacterium]|jgi:hypothetical protein|nr:hypothetical protein [Oscillospiraceae bacterium]
MLVTIDNMKFDFIPEASSYINPNIGKSDKFYIINRKDTPRGGFFSNYTVVCAHILYALKNSLIPIIDFQSYRTLFNESDSINGTTNSWEYYFEQPTNKTVEYAYRAKHILSKGVCYRTGLPFQQKRDGFFLDTLKNAVTSSIITNLIRPNEVTRTALKKDEELLSGATSSVGIHVRGTDRRCVDNDWDTKTCVRSVYIKELDSYLSRHYVDRIFLACDELDTVKAFEQRYGELLVYNDVLRAAGETIVGIHYTASSRVNNNYLLGLEVLRDAYMLSKCDALIFANSSVAAGAIMINGNKYKERIYVPAASYKPAQQRIHRRQITARKPIYRRNR